MSGLIVRSVTAAAFAAATAMVVVSCLGGSGNNLVVVESATDAALPPAGPNARIVAGWPAVVQQESAAADLVFPPWLVHSASAVPLLRPVQTELDGTALRRLSLLGRAPAGPVAFGSFSLERVSALLADPDISISLDLPGLDVLHLVKSTLREGTATDVAEQASGAAAVLTIIHGQLFGSIDVGGRVYSIVPWSNDVHAVFEGRRVHDDVGADNHQQWPQGPLQCATANEFVVSIGMTPNARKIWESPEKRVKAWHAELSLALQGVIPAPRFVFVAAQNDEGSSTEDDLTALAQPHGKWNDVHIPEADLAMLIVSRDDPKAEVSRIGALPSSRVAVVPSAATGNFSIEHEWGHLMGARHELEDDQGMWPFAFGHGFVAPSKGYRTIMATDRHCANCTRKNVFSTLSVAGWGKAGESEVDRAIQQAVSYVSSLSCASLSS